MRRLLLSGTVLAVLGNADTPWALDATWLANPQNNQWINGANWSSNPAVPNGTATFNASNTTNIAISSAFAGAMQFNAGASAYTFNISGLFFFDGSGAGVINNSSSIQTLALGLTGTLVFFGSSTAGSANVIISDSFASAMFLTASSAGNANIINNGSLSFSNQSTAGNATITTNATGRTILLGTSDGGQARFITNAGGRVDFSSGGPAGDKKISAGSIEGAGDYFLAGNQLTVGSNNLSTEVSGKISDGGSLIQTGASLVKIGTGTLTLSGNNAYTGVTMVNSGSLIVNGSIAASSAVNVNSGALLGGIGTLPSTTVGNGGTLAPGNSIGTLTVQGSLVLSTAATYLIEVSPTGADRTNVSGTATLAGTVSAAFASGSYVARNYTILSAAGGLSGTFNALTMTNLPAGFNANLSYTGTDVTLNLTANMGGPRSLSGLSINQANVANSLNSFFNNGGALPSNFATIFGLTGGNLASALSQLSGEAATGAQKVGFQATDQFLNLMLDPFVDGRSGIGAADHPALGFAPDQDTLPDDIALAYSKVLKGPPKAVPLYEPRWTVWGGAYGGSNRTTGDLAVTGSHDLSARTAGLAGGGTDWSLAQGLGRGRSDAFQAGVYGATKTGPAYLAAALAFANHWMSTDRFAFGDHLTANFNAQSYGGRLEGGYRLVTPYGGFTPYAAIQTQNFHTPGYTENGLIQNGFALAFSSRDATDTRSELGARFDRVLAFHGDAVLALRGRVAWAHDWVSDPTLTPLFQTLPGASFIVSGATPAKDSALASAGAEYRLANGVALLAKFDGEFASHSTTYAGRGMLRYAW